MSTFEMISTVEEGVLFAKDIGTISSWRVIPWWYLLSNANIGKSLSIINFFYYVWNYFSFTHTHTYIYIYIYIRSEVCYICRNGNKSTHLLAKHARVLSIILRERLLDTNPILILLGLKCVLIF